MCPSSTGTRYQQSASPVLWTENASTFTSCFLNAKIAISRLGGLSPRNHAMQWTRVELISDAATLNCWGFAFEYFSYSRVTSWSVMWIGHCMQFAWSVTAQCHSFASSVSPQQGCMFVFCKRKGLAEVLAMLWHELRPWTIPITQVQLPLPQIPFWKLSNLQKKLGSFGSLRPLHLIDAAVLNHRFKPCLGSEWLQAICHFEATLQIFCEIGLPMLPVSSWHWLSTCRVGSTQVSSNSCELKSKTFPCNVLAHSWVSTWRGLHASDWEIKCLTDLFQKPLCKWRIFEHAWSRLAALECGALWRA